MHFATCIAIYVLLLNPLRLIYYKNPLQWWYTCDFIYSDSKDKKKKLNVGPTSMFDYSIWLSHYYGLRVSKYLLLVISLETRSFVIYCYIPWISTNFPTVHVVFDPTAEVIFIDCTMEKLDIGPYIFLVRWVYSRRGNGSPMTYLY